MFAHNQIENILEPTVLTLAWNIRGRTRFVVGQLERNGNGALLKYFPNSEDYKKAQEMGFEPLYGFNDPTKVYTDGVLDYFMSRITSRERDDFNLYLQTLAINPLDADKISDFALLGYGEGRLPGDGFQVINSFENAIPPMQFVTELAAMSHCEFDFSEQSIRIGTPVSFVPEPDNNSDPCAIKVMCENNHIGYINRIQAQTICRWIENGVILSGNIFRKNGRPTAPRYFIFVEVRGEVQLKSAI